MSPDGRDEALELDDADALGRWRGEFVFPRHPRGTDDGAPVVYLCGNSLGLMPRAAARAAVQRVLDQWETFAVEGHFTGDEAWYRYDEPIAGLQAPLVGAEPGEVALANGLTVDLHLLLATFYRPQGRRTKILLEPHAFPSDRYAAQGQAAWHGLDPDVTVLTLATADPDRVTLDDLAAIIERHGDEIAVALLGGVNYYTGQLLPLADAATLLREAGIVVGYDLAHAVGNVPLHLHDWNVDFAAWCTYKYLNGGPGSAAGFFVHERHGDDPARIRLGGWWGNDPATRFAMHDQERFVPRLGADGWKISNPSILSMAPVGASLRVFDQAGMGALRAKSVELTGFLARLLDELPEVTVLTPNDPTERGAQISIRVPGSASAMERALSERGVIVDARDPDVLRVAPAPLYNTFADCWDAVAALSAVLADDG